MGFFDSILGGIGSIFGASQQSKAAEQNVKMQKQFAKQGIQWKVEDAKKAGINPYYALGASTNAFSPVSVGDPASTFGSIGQNFGRAIDSTSTHETQDRAFRSAVQKLTLQKMGLENELLSSQIATTKQPANGPAMPSAMQRWLVDGQGSVPLVNTVPMKVNASEPSNSSSEPGAVSDIGYARTTRGYAPVPSEDTMKRMSNDFIGMMNWNIRNRLFPMVGANMNPPPKSSLPKGASFWQFNPFTWEYYPVTLGPNYF